MQARLTRKTGIGRYRFTHASWCKRHSLDELEAVEGAPRLHRRVGEALEQLHAERPWPIPHGAGPPLPPRSGISRDKTRKRSPRRRQAAARALAQLAWEEAIGHYERALAVLDLTDTPDERQRCELLLALGETQALAGDGEKARSTLYEVARLGETTWGHAASKSGPPRTRSGASGSTMSMRSRSDSWRMPWRSSVKRKSAARVQVLAKLAGALHYVPGSEERRRALSEEALGIARRSGDPAVLAFALAARQPALWGPDNLEERLVEGAEGLATYDLTQDPASALWGRAVRWWYIHDLLEAGDFPAFQEQMETSFRLWADSRVLLDKWLVKQYRTLLSLLAGRFGTSGAPSDRILSIGPAGLPHPGADPALRAATAGDLVRAGQNRRDGGAGCRTGCGRPNHSDTGGARWPGFLPVPGVQLRPVS